MIINSHMHKYNINSWKLIFMLEAKDSGKF